MKNLKNWILIALLGALFGNAAMAAEIEVVATLESLNSGPAGLESLTVRLTPAVVIDVRVTAATEFEDRDGLPIAASSLMAGDTLRIEAFFTTGGLLAEEVKRAAPATDFEIKGPLAAVDPANRIIRVQAIPILVPATAEIADQAGNSLTLSQLTIGETVKVEGDSGSGQLVARQVRTGTGAPVFAQLNFSGVISEISGSSLSVILDGGQRVLVQISDMTRIRGSLAVGVRVTVVGALTPGLAVAATQISTQQRVRFLPDEVRLDFRQTARVDVVLASTATSDVIVTLSSRNATVATPDPAQLRIPAGALTASFQVRSGAVEGRTFIDAVLPVELGSGVGAVEVEVENDGPDDTPGQQLLEIKFSPDKIETGPSGARQVQLVLNGLVGEDVPVLLTLKEGVAGQVSFPSMVIIPAGERSTPVTVQIGENISRTKIRATLPAALGGDTDDLEIDIRSADQQNLDLRWTPDDVELSPGGNATVALRLDRPAPVDFEVVLTVREGDPTLVATLPQTLIFRRGQRDASLRIQAGSRSGRLRVTAALPFELGGDDDDLKIEIEE